MKAYQAFFMISYGFAFTFLFTIFIKPTHETLAGLGVLAAVCFAIALEGYYQEKKNETIQKPNRRTRTCTPIGR